MGSRFIQDLRIYSRGSVLRGILTIFLDMKFHAVVNYRIAHALSRVKLVPICKLIMNWNRIVHSVEIDYRADLAGGFHLIHGLGVVIGKDVRTLGPVKIYQNVTLGGNNGKEIVHDVYGRMTQPVLEKGCVVYTGACCFGPIVIGEGATIGAMAVCTHDVPAHNIYYNKIEHIMKEQ